jgi:predicted TIM-barrel fold metal-dependent hydrolase
MNDFCGELAQRDPQRFGAFAMLPLPDVDAAIAELEYALDVVRLDGVILFSNYDGHYLGDDMFEALHAELNRRKAVVLVHPCTPLGLEMSHLRFPESMLEVCFETTRTAYSLILGGVMKRYPDIRFILAHAGGATPYLAGRASITASLLENAHGLGPAIGDAAGVISSAFHGLKQAMPNLLRYYVEFKQNVLPEGPLYFLKRFFYDTALSASPHVWGSLLTVAAPSQILFGSDYCFAGGDAIFLTTLGLNEYGGLLPPEKAAVAKANAIRLFPRFAHFDTATGQ